MSNLVGSNGAEAVITAAGALKVDATASTQPVSGTVTVVQGTASNLNANVSGTVTSNIGTAGTLALDATLTGGTQKTKLVDTGGTNVASVSAANALKVDGSAVTQPVSGTFFQATQPVSIAATVNTTQALVSTANIVAGSATTTGSTIVTIPINRIWQGWITLSAGLVAGASAQNSTPTVTIVSAGTSFPATTTVLLSLTLSTGTGVTENSQGGTTQVFVTVGAPTATNTATLQLNAGSATAPTSMIATAAGLLL